MWYRIKITRTEILPNGKEKRKLEYYLADVSNFIEAGYKVMEKFNGDCEVEDVTLMKTYKPLGNDKYGDGNKVFIVKIAEDYKDDNGNVKTMKYPIPFFANNASELQSILKDYLALGLESMRVTTISETKWEII